MKSLSKNKHYLKRNLKLYRFKFLTVIIKIFVKNTVLFDNVFLLKIKNIDIWFKFFFSNLWKFFRSFYFENFLEQIVYFKLKNFFNIVTNAFFRFNPKKLLEFFMNAEEKIFMNDELFIFFRILYVFFLKKDLFLRLKFIRPTSIKVLQGEWLFFFSFVNDEKFDMFGQRGFMHNLIVEKTKYISISKSKLKSVDRLYNIFVSERLTPQLKFFMEKKPFIKKGLRRSIFMIYYTNIWILLYKTKQRVKKYSKYFRYSTNFLRRKYKSIAIRKFLWKHHPSKGAAAQEVRTEKLISLIKLFLNKKRKKPITNYGKFIDYDKFKFYKKRKKFKYDKRYKGFKFKRGIIHLNSSRSNYFVTLTDLSYKPIHGVTSGKFSQSTNKKAKKSSTAIYVLLKYLFIFMKAHRINSVILEVRNRFDPLFHQCLNFLRYKKIHIYKIYLTRQLPHHKGLRKRKLRRI